MDPSSIDPSVRSKTASAPLTPSGMRWYARRSDRLPYPPSTRAFARTSDRAGSWAKHHSLLGNAGPLQRSPCRVIAAHVDVLWFGLPSCDADHPGSQPKPTPRIGRSPGNFARHLKFVRRFVWRLLLDVALDLQRPRHDGLCGLPQRFVAAVGKAFPRFAQQFPQFGRIRAR